MDPTTYYPRDSAAAQEARVERANSAPLAACTQDRCKSGRKACPCPDACQLPEPGSDFFDWIADLAGAAKIVLWCALGIVVAFVSGWLVFAGFERIAPHWAVAVAAFS